MKITKKQLESLVESTIKEQRLNKNKPRIWLISKERSSSRESDWVLFVVSTDREDALLQAKKTLGNENFSASPIDEEQFDLMSYNVPSELKRLQNLIKSAKIVKQKLGI